MISEELEKWINSVGDDVVSAAQREIAVNRKDSTGTLRNSLFYTRTANGLEFSSTTSYWQFIHEGRRRGGRMPPVDRIVEWMRQKPVRLRDSGGRYLANDESRIRGVAFVIARSIAERGQRPFPFYDNVMNDVVNRRVAELDETLKLELEQLMTTGL